MLPSYLCLLLPQMSVAAPAVADGDEAAALAELRGAGGPNPVRRPPPLARELSSELIKAGATSAAPPTSASANATAFVPNATTAAAAKAPLPLPSSVAVGDQLGDAEDTGHALETEWLSPNPLPAARHPPPTVTALLAARAAAATDSKRPVSTVSTGGGYAIRHNRWALRISAFAPPLSGAHDLPRLVGEYLTHHDIEWDALSADAKYVEVTGEGRAVSGLLKTDTAAGVLSTQPLARCVRRFRAAVAYESSGVLFGIARHATRPVAPAPGAQVPWWGTTHGTIERYYVCTGWPGMAMEGDSVVGRLFDDDFKRAARERGVECRTIELDIDLVNQRVSCSLNGRPFVELRSGIAELEQCYVYCAIRACSAGVTVTSFHEGETEG
jgi:hypothetical protein